MGAKVETISAADVEMVGAACGVAASFIFVRMVVRTGDTFRWWKESRQSHREYREKHPQLGPYDPSGLSEEFLELIIKNLPALKLSAFLYLVCFVCFLASAIYRFFALP